MMKYLWVLVLMLSSLYADRDGGPYIAIGYGSSQFDDDGLYTSLKNDKTGAASVAFGAYINKHLSVEFNYTDMSAFNTSNGIEVDDTTNLKLFALDFSTLAHYAFFDDLWDFYAKFGVGEMHQDNSEIKGFSFVYGVGTSIRFNEVMSLKFALDRFDFGYDANGDNSQDYAFKIDYIYTALEFQF